MNAATQSNSPAATVKATHVYETAAIRSDSRRHSRPRSRLHRENQRSPQTHRLQVPLRGTCGPVATKSADAVATTRRDRRGGPLCCSVQRPRSGERSAARSTTDDCKPWPPAPAFVSVMQLLQPPHLSMAPKNQQATPNPAGRSATDGTARSGTSALNASLNGWLNAGWSPEAAAAATADVASLCALTGR